MMLRQGLSLLGPTTQQKRSLTANITQGFQGNNMMLRQGLSLLGQTTQPKGPPTANISQGSYLSHILCSAATSH